MSKLHWQQEPKNGTDQHGCKHRRRKPIWHLSATFDRWGRFTAAAGLLLTGHRCKDCDAYTYFAPRQEVRHG